MSELSGTKELIFDIFIELVSTLGYENVSMRDIAKKIGIKAASIYNHFETKGQILEYAYDYYVAHMYDKRKPANEVKKLIETASAKEIIDAINYTFETENQIKYTRMVLITKIIYMRLFQDSIANSIYTDLDKNNIEYIVDILTHAVIIGRLDSNFNKEIFAEVLIGARSIMGIKEFSDSSYVVGQVEKESSILALFTQLLSFSIVEGCQLNDCAQ